MKPWYRAQLPFVAGVVFIQSRGGVGEFGRIVRSRIPADAFVIDRLRRELGIGKLPQHIVEMLFGCRPILFHERDAR